MTDILASDDIIPPRPVADSDEPQTMVVDIAGLTVTVRRPKDAQLVLFGRYARIIARTEAKARGITDEETLRKLWQSTLGTMSDALEVLEYMIVNTDDRDEVEAMMRRGEIEIPDLVAVVKAFNVEPDDSTALVTKRPPNARRKR